MRTFTFTYGNWNEENPDITFTKTIPQSEFKKAKYFNEKYNRIVIKDIMNDNKHIIGRDPYTFDPNMLRPSTYMYFDEPYIVLSPEQREYYYFTLPPKTSPAYYNFDSDETTVEREGGVNDKHHDNILDNILYIEKYYEPYFLVPYDFSDPHPETTNPIYYELKCLAEDSVRYSTELCYLLKDLELNKDITIDMINNYTAPKDYKYDMDMPKDRTRLLLELLFNA